MTSNSTRYAYYGFPPTPTRESPRTRRTPPGSETTTSDSRSSSSYATAEAMSPSPTAGRQQQQSGDSKTPTKAARRPGQTPQRSVKPPPKLGQSSQRYAQGDKDEPSTPRAASTQQPESDEPRTPTIPKTKDAGDRARQGKGPSQSQVGEADKKLSQATGGAQDGENETDDHEPLSKVTQASESASDEMQNAEPEPISDDENDGDGDAVKGATDESRQASDDAGHGISMEDNDNDDDATEHANQTGQSTDDQADKGDSRGQKQEQSQQQPQKQQKQQQNRGGGLLSGAKSLAGKASGLAGRANGSANKTKDSASKAGSTANKASRDPKSAAQDTKQAGEDTAKDVGETVQKGTDDAKRGVEDATEEVKDTAKEGVDGAKDTADNAADQAEDGLGKAEDTAQDATNDAEDTARDMKNDVEDTAKNATDDAEGAARGATDNFDNQAAEAAEDTEQAAEGGADETAHLTKDQAEEATEGLANDTDETQDLPIDLSVLKGLEVEEDGMVHDHDHNAVGRLAEGDAEDLAGYPIGDDGEILDDDGDLVGRVELLPDEIKRQLQAKREEGGELPEGAEKYLDRVDSAQEDVQEEAGGAIDNLPGLNILEGLTCQLDGLVYDADGNTIGKVTDGDPEDLKHATLNDQGEFIDDDGNVVGHADLHEEVEQLVEQGVYEPQELADEAEDKGEDVTEAVQEESPQEIEDQLPGIEALQGRELNEAGEIVDDQGNLLAGIEDDGLKQKIADGEIDPATLTIDPHGQVLDEAGNVLSKTELAEGAAERLAGLLDFRILDGRKINKKGQILDDDGEAIGELTDGDLPDCTGQKANARGEVHNKQNQLVGHVRVVPGEAAQAATRELLEELGELEAAADDDETASTPQDLSFLEGFRVNRKGVVLDEDGEVIGELASGDLGACAGKRLSADGEVLDPESGEVVGTVRAVGREGEGEAQAEGEGEPQLPPLSDLEGLTVNKAGNLLSASGEVVGVLVEGDARKLCRSGAKADAEGRFRDGKGRVVGRAETVAVEDEDEEDEAVFAGFEGLRVAEEGWVKDAEGNTVGYVVEGDVGKLKGREVDEDGEILDKKGNVVGRAERYEEGEGEEKVDLGFLKGKTVSKTGMVMGDEGVPVARLVEGSAKELAGRKLDGEGQLWDDSGKVIGRVELIPEEERERKPEGPFAGLEDLRVIKGGRVADEDGNVVGEIVEGNARRLIGLAVDEDGDIIDKYGNVKGRAEPLPEEEATDYSILDGLTVNKQGNVVDSNGVPYGKLVQGNAAELAGRQCDENGYIYNDTGKVVGHCEPLPEEERVAKPEGPFAGIQGLRVVKGGKVVDKDGNEVGEITEGDAKRLVGLSVDEDGDIIDKFGNTKGHAEPLVEEEQETVDNSVLNNKTVNKQGYVVDERGIPFGRLVEGNISELAGRKCDENGNIYGDTGKIVGRCEVLPEDERVARPEGPFAGLEGLRVVREGFVEDNDGNRVGQIVEGDARRLVGLHVDEDGDIIDKYGNVKGHAEPWSEQEEQEADLSALAGTVINKAGYAVDGNGTVLGQIAEGNVKHLIGKRVDGQGQIWDDSGNVIGRCELAHGAGSPEGPFAGFEGLQIQKDGSVTTPAGDVVGRVIEGDIKKLLGHGVDEDGDITDKNGNALGRAERWEPEEKERRANPMSGHRVNKAGEVRDSDGEWIGRLTAGDLGHCVGQEVDDAGNVVDVEGNKIGEATLLADIAEDEYEGPSEDELAEASRREDERQIAERMGGICTQTLERVHPICAQITEAMERADRTPREELDEEALVERVRPLIEEGGRVLQECNGSLRGLDPDGKIAAQAKGRAGTGEATPEEYRLAETLKELTTTVVKCVDDAKKKLNDMPHAKKKLNPLWALLTQPLFQILAAVGLLLAGVLGLVGQLLNALGLGGLVNGLLGGLGINKLLSSLGLGGDDGKKGKKGGGPLGDIPVVGGLLGGKKE